MQDTYEASEARTTLELLDARYARLKHPPSPPDLGKIPPSNPQAVTTLYLNTARWIAGGLLDRLAGRSVWHPRVDPAILRLAKQTGLTP